MPDTRRAARLRTGDNSSRWFPLANHLDRHGRQVHFRIVVEPGLITSLLLREFADAKQEPGRTVPAETAGPS